MDQITCWGSRPLRRRNSPSGIGCGRQAIPRTTGFPMRCSISAILRSAIQFQRTNIRLRFFSIWPDGYPRVVRTPRTHNAHHGKRKFCTIVCSAYTVLHEKNGGHPDSRTLCWGLILYFSRVSVGRIALGHESYRSSVLATQSRAEPMPAPGCETDLYEECCRPRPDVRQSPNTESSWPHTKREPPCRFSLKPRTLSSTSNRPRGAVCGDQYR